MSTRRGTARAVGLTCPKCASPFTVVAFLSQGINASDYWKPRKLQRHRLCGTRKSARLDAQGGRNEEPVEGFKSSRSWQEVI